MTLWKLKIVVEPGEAHVVAVRGLSDTDNAPWIEDTGVSPGGIVDWFRENYRAVRFSVFSYDPAGIFSLPGLQDTAARLLGSLVELRRGDQEKRNIIFLCHDIAGNIVKQALMSAIYGNPEAHAIVEHTRALFYMGCLVRSDNLEHMQRGIERLFQISNPSGTRLSPVLAGSLAEAIVYTNWTFTKTNLVNRLILISICSTLNDLEASVFELRQTALGFKVGRRSTRTRSQFFSREEHASLGTRWIWGPEGASESIKNAIKPVFTASQPLAADLDLSHLHWSPVMPQSPDLYKRLLKPHIADDKVFEDWKSQQGGGLLAIHEPNDPVETAVSIFSKHIHTNSDSHQIPQFFEFRDWDIRYNSIDSMLSQFVAELLELSTSPNAIFDAFEGALRASQAWSNRLLLTAFQELLIAHRVDMPSSLITWVLVDFDDRVKSYQWLLSMITTLVVKSELGFKVVIVNRRPLNLGDTTQYFSIIAPRNSDTIHQEFVKETQQSAEVIDRRTELVAECKSKEEVELYQSPGSSTESISVEETVWELIATYPELYPARQHVSAIIQSTQTNTVLLELAKKWLKVNARVLALADLDEQLTQIVPVSLERLFPRLWMPFSSLSISAERRKQIITATELLFYSLRELSVREIRDLEKHTKYSEQIGVFPHSYFIEDDNPRTLLLLPGIVSVYHDDVRFSHPQFRDYLQQTPFFDATTARRAHARIADWCVERITSAAAQSLEPFQTDQADFMQPQIQDDIMGYAIRYWVKHAKLAGPEADSLDSIKALSGNYPLLLQWSKAYWGTLHPAIRGDASSMTPLAIFALEGLESLLVAHMDARRSLSSYPHEYLQAMRWAARSGELNTVRRLSAAVETNEEKIDMVILDAFVSRNPDIIRELIKVAKKRPKTLAEPVHVLAMAAYHGHIEAVKSLIPEISPEAVKEHGSSVTLMAIVGSSLQESNSLEVMKTLLTSNFPINNLSDMSANNIALVAAAGLGNPYLTVMLAEQLAQTINAEAGPDDSCTGEKGQWWCQVGAALRVAAQNYHHEVIRALLSMVAHIQWKEPTDLLPTLLESTFGTRPQCTEILLSHFVQSNTVEQLQDSARALIKSAAERNDATAVRVLMDAVVELDPDSILELFVSKANNGAEALEVIELLENQTSQLCPHEAYVEALGKAFASAVKYGDAEVVRYLVKKEPDLEAHSIGARTPLYDAAYAGRTEIVRILLNAKANPKTAGNNDDDETPLHGAYDLPEILELLLASGADVNAKTLGGDTALTYATRYHCEKSILVLLKHDADVNIQSEGETILTNTVNSEDMELTVKILEAGADPLGFHASAVNDPLLHTCVRDDLYNILKELLLYDIPVNELDAKGETALCCISSKTSVPVLKLMISRGAKLNFDAEGETRCPALSVAIAVKNKDAVRYLIESGADIHARVGKFGTSLHTACSDGNLETVQLLVEKGCDINHDDPGIGGLPLQAALYRSASDAKDTIIEYLLSIKSLDVKRSSTWWGVYLNTACLCANLNVVARLIELGCPLDVEDRMGRQPIHFALYRTVESVQLLCKHGADLHVQDRMGRSGLHFAVISGRLDLVKYVLGDNKDLVHKTDIDNWTPLLWAMRVCNRWETETAERAGIIQELLDSGADKLVQGDGLVHKWTAYDLACYYGLTSEILQIVTPSDAELDKLDGVQKLFWRQTLQNDTQRARVHAFDYCDACLMDSVGTGYVCDSCPGFYLCFKCYLSKNLIHPGHDFVESNEDSEYTSGGSSRSGSSFGSAAPDMSDRSEVEDDSEATDHEGDTEGELEDAVEEDGGEEETERG